MGVVRTKSGLASTTRTTRDQLIIFIDIITKNHFLEGRRRDWSESDSSIQPLYGKFHALCLPVGGASLANDDVMRGGGAAEIGMWRKQVRAPASSHTNLELLALDKPTRPLLSSDWSESDSSIQPLYGKFHALCLPVGGASLANDDVMRGGGAAEIGMWRKQVR